MGLPTQECSADVPTIYAQAISIALCGLQPGDSTERIRYGFSGLIIFTSEANQPITDASGASRTVAGVAGDNIWHDGPADIEIRNTGPCAYKAVLGEWC